MAFSDFNSIVYLTRPVRTATGTEMNPAIRIQEKIAANFLIAGVYRGWLKPRDWNMLQIRD